MAEVLISPDIEAAVVAFLSNVLSTSVTKVATKVPSVMPERMVKVTNTGSDRLGVAADMAQVTIECWAPDALSASLVARTAYAHLIAAAGSVAGGVFVRRADSVSGVQSFPDPDTARPRYIFTIRWYVRPATL